MDYMGRADVQEAVEWRPLAVGDDGVLVKAAVSPRRAGRVRRRRSGRARLPTTVGDQRPGHGHVDRAVVGVVERSAVAQLVVIARDVVVAEMMLVMRLLLMLKLARQRRLGQ